MGFEQPSEGGDRIEWKHYLGCLMLFEVAGVKTGIKTKFTKPGEDGKEAVTATITVLTDRKGQVLAEPMVKRNTMVFPGFLVGALSGSVGRMVLGRLGQKPTDKGNDAWILEKFTDEDGAVAQKYLDSRKEQAAQSADQTATDEEADPFAP